MWSIPPMVERTDLIDMLPRRFLHGLAGSFALDIHELPIEMREQFLYMMWRSEQANPTLPQMAARLDHTDYADQTQHPACDQGRTPETG
jgi:hypothetical protein